MGCMSEDIRANDSAMDCEDAILTIMASENIPICMAVEKFWEQEETKYKEKYNEEWADYDILYLADLCHTLQLPITENRMTRIKIALKRQMSKECIETWTNPYLRLATLASYATRWGFIMSELIEPEERF